MSAAAGQQKSASKMLYMCVPVPRKPSLPLLCFASAFFARHPDPDVSCLIPHSLPVMFMANKVRCMHGMGCVAGRRSC